jgi:SAM-dependent methyltransferase
MSVHPVARGFQRAADDYERARPTFPPEAVAFVADRLDLRSGRTVLDLAAGTGKLTRLLAATGAEVIAVEPIRAMRQKLVETTPAARVLDGVAEAIPLPEQSVDAATVAQAFHWFDRERAYHELARVIRPGGALALVWNTRDRSHPLQASLEAILKPYRDAAVARDWNAEYDAAARKELFGEWEEWRHAWAQPFDRGLLTARVASTSFVAGLPEEERRRLLDRVLAVAEGLDEPFAFPYVTEVFICRRHTDKP